MQRKRNIQSCRHPEWVATDKDELLNILPCVQGAPIHPHNRVPISEILRQRFYCEKYGVEGRWVSDGKTLAIQFCHEGQQYLLPFSALFDDNNMIFLCDAAVLQMEEKIEDQLFEHDCFEIW